MSFGGIHPFLLKKAAAPSGDDFISVYNNDSGLVISGITTGDDADWKYYLTQTDINLRFEGNSEGYNSLYVCLVAGGGGGGGDGQPHAGGGGAGGVIGYDQSKYFVPDEGQVYDFDVGGGGAIMTQGTNTKMSTLGSVVTGYDAVGGGYGHKASAGGSGGSGGGSRVTAGSGTAGQGNDGGADGGGFAEGYRSGGGGGRGSAGDTGTSSGDGGDSVNEILTDFSGYDIAGGGGGGSTATGPGSDGGGTSGGDGGFLNGLAGDGQYGGGGGGFGYGSSSGGTGGDGMLIIRWQFQ